MLFWVWALKSRDLTTQHHIARVDMVRLDNGTRLNRSQRVDHPSAQEKNWTCWTISELNPVCHDSTAAHTVACSFLCSQPFCRRSYGVPTAACRQQQQQQQQRGRRQGQAGARASRDNISGAGASESAMAAAATTSDDCCKVCIVTPRAGFALVPCGHRTRRQYTRHNDDKEIL